MIKAERERSIEREPILGDQYQEMTFRASGFLWSLGGIGGVAGLQVELKQRD